MTVTLPDQDTARQILEDATPECDHHKCVKRAEWALLFESKICTCRPTALVCTPHRRKAESVATDPLLCIWVCDFCNAEAPDPCTWSEVFTLARIEPLQ